MASIKISEIIQDLSNGYVRYKRQDTQKTGKSIQEKYNLSDADMLVLTQHEKVKGIRTKQISSLVLIDDTNTTQITEPVKVIDTPKEEIVIKKSPVLGAGKGIEPVM